SFEGDTGGTVRLTFKVTDRFGVPVANVPVQFRPSVGGGSIKQEGKTTDDLGVGYADVILGDQYGFQEFYVQAGTLEYYFTGRARLRPSIMTSGVVNAGSLRVGQGLAPRPYIPRFRRGAARGTRG